ncbi:MAG TPA: CYTH domain-containing protein, partial [Candidatus Limnocylindrales bacterium]|nr:CYTH domain-containing protein [Candidatus Limnocylindrales bacterium]
MAAGIEAELKLSATDDSALDSMAAAERLGPARLGPARTVLETDAYLDTPDGRLAAARWACRLRTRAERSWISLKGPATHRRGAVLHRRPEIDGPVGDP